MKGCLILFLLHFYIKDIGLDYEVYKNWYYQIGIAKENLFQLEGFVYKLILYMNKLNLSHRIFFLFMGGVSLYLNLVIEKKECKNIYIGTICLFLLNFFSGFNDAIRQFLAASFFLFSLYMVENKKKWFGYFIILLIPFIHKSSSLIILLYPLFYLNWTIIRYIIISLIISVIGLISKHELINLLLSLNLFSQEKIIRINYYLNYDSIGYTYSNFLHKFLLNLGVYFYYIGTIILYIIFLKEKKLSNFQKKILNSGIVGTFVATYLMIVGSKTLGFRFLLLFGIGNYILLENIQRRRKKLFLIIYFLLYNLIILLYNAGIHDIKSPFYLL